ncbi:MAG: VapE domain-containing protein, partial [Halochromatium sp.]|uniref:VapE domain-containing protein n=1 Tax=Halochromatium sp. TaxID=2049430 RepID=UPI003978087A
LRFDGDEFTADGQLHRVSHREDRAGKHNGWYVAHRLRLDRGDEVIVGAYGWWKEGGTHKIKLNLRGLSDAEKRQIAARRRDAEKRARRAREQLAKEAAERANRLWPKLPEEGGSDYLTRKQVTAWGVRFSRGTLVIPLRTSPDDLVGLQFIDADGTKRFLTGTAKQGAFHLLGPRPQPGDTLGIAEGYATAASVRAAMGWSVACVFDCGNLIAAMRNLQRQLPGVQLVVCADNDCASPGNPGVTKGREAAAKLRARFAVPVLADGSSGDFNDLHVSEGLEAVRAQIDAALGEQAPQATPNPATSTEGGAGGNPPAYGNVVQGRFPGSDWRDRLIRSDKGNIKPTAFNTRLILEHDPAWQDVLGWCEFSHQIIKRRDPPLEHASRGPWDDTDDAELRYWLPERYDGIEPRGQDLADAVIGAARARPFHPVCDYLDGLHWDGRARLDTWLMEYLGCAPVPEECAHEGAAQTEEARKQYDEGHHYLTLVGSLWLIQAVSRVRSPGLKADAVLILEGEQGRGKSTALRVLFGDDWFSDTPIDIGSKDSYEALRGLWCMELAELDALSKADSRRAKAFFSSPKDRFRLPYGKRSTLFTRQCVVAGTTNEFAHLKDYTGNRRYWSATVGKIDLEALAEDRDQLWAEADHRFRQREPWWPRKEDEHLFRDQQEARMDIDVWESVIVEFLNGLMRDAMPGQRHRVQVTMATLMEQALNIDRGSMRRPEQTRVGQIMHRLGWVNTRPRVNGKREYGYRPSAGYIAQFEAVTDTRPPEAPTWS